VAGAKAESIIGSAGAVVLDAPVPLRQSGQLPARDVVRAFLDAPPREALKLWLAGRVPRDRAQLEAWLADDIGAIDVAMSRQVNAILHHDAFRKLESRWRGLQKLVESWEPFDINGGIDPRTGRPEVTSEQGVIVRVLNVTWREISADIEASTGDAQQSELFRKVYTEEFDTPGGKPFGLLLCDHEIRLKPGPGHPTDDLATLDGLAQVAAAAFAPIALGTHPSLMGLASFNDLQRLPDLDALTTGPDFIRLKALRSRADMRFVGMMIPRVLAREPYRDDGTRDDGFAFREESGRAEEWCWSSPVWSMGIAAIRTWTGNRWFSDMVGVRRGAMSGGLIGSFPGPSFETDAPGVAFRPATDVVISDEMERVLTRAGLVSLCPCREAPHVAMYNAPSFHTPTNYDSPEATANARLSAMLPYVMCVSRFAHYVKQIGRSKVGSVKSPEDVRQVLQNWISESYVSSDPDSELPLRAADVQVRELPPGSGRYVSTMWFEPHYQFEGVSARLELKTELLRSS
jgi:type VI secretion system protein ImpD